MDNYNEKILTIKEDEKRLLEIVKTKISEENPVFNQNINNVIEVLKQDENVVKKYEAIVKTQELIREYTNDILNATSVEELVEIRKKLNSCINKVKREMIKRGYNEVDINNYCDKVKEYRKLISTNIRFIKRKEKVNEIEELNSKYDSLNEEEQERLKKLVKNELSYIKKYQKVYDNSSITSELKEKKDKKNLHEKLDFHFPPITVNGVNNLKVYDNLHDYLDSEVSAYDSRYKIQKTNDYTGNVIKNLAIFANNLPVIIDNKHKSKRVARDYDMFYRRPKFVVKGKNGTKHVVGDRNMFYRKPELYGYSRYLTWNNSLLHHAKEILSHKEDYYANEHEKCINWITDFCKEHNLQIQFVKKHSNAE